MSVECELKGLNELLNTFEKLGIKSNIAQHEGLNKSADVLLNEVRHTDKFVDKSGRLRESLKKSNVRTRSKLKFIWVGDVDGLTDYSWFVEYGRNGKTGYVAPTSFLRGTTSENADLLRSIMIQELRKGLNV